MDITKLHELPAEERQMQLRAMACKVEEGTYFKKYSADEIDAVKDSYTDMQIELGDAEDQYKEFTKDFREKIKRLRERNKLSLQSIRMGGVNSTGVTYFIDAQAEGKMYQVDEDGNVISSRRLRPDEKQSTVFNQHKTAANG